jgi:hypothetical protein
MSDSPSRFGCSCTGESVRRSSACTARALAHVAELARHFAEVAAVGDAAKALPYARLAGERAIDEGERLAAEALSLQPR